jgi:hypothetical protein
MSSHRKQIAIGTASVVVAIIVFLIWSSVPRYLNEPYLHYAAEQWRTIWNGNLLERESRRIAGTDALDCGRVPSKSSPERLNNCIETARSTKRAFKSRWELTAIDAEVEGGLFGTADGRVFHFQYLEGPHVPGYRKIDIHECPAPIALKTNSVTGVLDCQ